MVLSWRETLEEAARRRLHGEFDQARQLVRAFQPANAAERRAVQLVAWAHEPFWWQVLEGRRCRLHRRSAQDLAFIRSVWADEQFMSSFNRFARSLPAADPDLANLLAREYASVITDTRSVHWTIETHDGRKVGILSFVDISPSNRRAEVLIGLAEFPYLGVSVEAMLLAIEFGFGVMGLHKICAMLYATNKTVQRNARHLGFHIEGRLREHIADPRTRERIDVIQLGLLRSDLNKSPLDRISLRLLGRRLAS